MSHITLFARQTETKNMVQCCFCEKMYKIDNGSSGFIRHLRCKHPEFLHKMGGVSERSKERKMKSSDTLLLGKGETENNNIDYKVKVEPSDEMILDTEEFSSNQILANFVNQMELGQSDVRIAEKRPRISPSPLEILTAPDKSFEEPDFKIFAGDNPLQKFLSDINRKFGVQNGEIPSQHSNESGEASTSMTALEMPISQKASRDPSPNSSLISEINGGTETVDSSPRLRLNPMIPFGCVFCPCSFPLIKDLHIHVTHVHRTSYRCNFCLAEFVAPEHLEHHFTMVHVTGGVVETTNSQ
ncbi:hypothetical protein GCK72_002514 [Caenorhabditis remanei]|uniref:C2H2-type domain-containing protein n=1 Tax=Caenorhabditis remanei TaxID=31234 RepID=A0A6A5HWG0_CAERE|nr:hypothetical protein GCK72_002514 [Caenorhabditis remanei]KAF1770693.1 hypothetical protein GCK72_002514 [Caenorhabditis remanei]